MDGTRSRGEDQRYEGILDRPPVGSRGGPVQPMMEGEETPLGSRTCAELVEQVIASVDLQTERDRHFLLTDLLCAAWPSDASQDN
jgi:hypothetical protein